MHLALVGSETRPPTYPSCYLVLPFLATLILADTQPDHPARKPFATLAVNELPSDYHYQNSLRNRVLIDPTNKTLLIFHHSNLLTLVDLVTQKQKETITFGKPHPEKIVLAGRKITFYDRIMRKQLPENRTYDLDLKVEERIPQDKFEPNLFAQKLDKYLDQQKLDLRRLFVLDDKTILTLETPSHRYNEYSVSIRSAEDFHLIRTAALDKPIDYHFYLSPDKNILAAHNENGNYTDLISVKNFKRLRRVWNECGYLEFDPHHQWAINHGTLRGYAGMYGMRPLLVNLKNFNIYLLGNPPHDVHDSVVDSSLNLAITINNETVDFYHLPE